MAALTAITPLAAGAVSAGAAVAASDTIAASIIGSRGAYLEVLNGNAATDSITISDAGFTPAGNALAGGTYSVSVNPTSNKIFYIAPAQVNLTTQVVTVTHTVTATVTYKLYPTG